jgi:hypothetical protein
MRKPRTRTKKPPKRVLALPDLEHAKVAVLNSLTSVSAQPTTTPFASLSCGTVRSHALRSIARSSSDIAFISNYKDSRQPRSICGWPLSGELRMKRRTRGSSALNWRPGFDG